MNSRATSICSAGAGQSDHLPPTLPEDAERGLAFVLRVSEMPVDVFRFTAMVKEIIGVRASIDREVKRRDSNLGRPRLLEVVVGVSK